MESTIDLADFPAPRASFVIVFRSGSGPRLTSDLGGARLAGPHFFA